MRHTKSTLLLFLALLAMIILLLPERSFAQQGDTTRVQVETKDGNQYMGTITFQNDEILKLKTEKLGELSFNKSDIAKITPINARQLKKGAYWFDNPQSTRYFWSQNGYGLKKGEAYYQNVWVLFNQVNVGVTNNFSVGAGLVPLFFFGGAPTPVWINPKFSIPISKDKFNIGAGALAGTVLGEEDTGFGIVYGMTTFGSRDRNVSVGLGYGFTGDEFADSPMISISSMIRTGPRGYFLTENYYIGTADETVVLLSFGGRRIIKRSGLDFGLFIPFVSEMDTFVAIPWLGITIPLGGGSKQAK